MVVFKLNSNDREKFIKFLMDNYDKFPQGVKDFFDNHFSLDEVYQFDFMAEIYAYLFPQKYMTDFNFYTCYITCLFNKFPDLKERKVLEIASGLIPGLAYLIEKIIKPNNISCMDPRLLNLPVRGVKQIKNKFTMETDISPYDLLIAHCPCEAFEVIVNRVLEEPKDICIQTCRCYGDEYLSDFRFRRYIIKQIIKLEKLQKYGYYVDTTYTPLMINEAPVITLKRGKNV